jgi:hypothetical protein
LAARIESVDGKAWAVATASALAAAAGIWRLQSLPLRWSGERPATCMPASCFCEAVRDSAVRQPSNTWSCLAYVFLGALILGARLRPGWTRRRLLNTLAFGALLTFLGLTSVYFHAALTFRSEWYDAMFLFLMPGYLLVFNLWRERALDGSGARWALAALTAASGWFLAFAQTGRRLAFIALVASYLLSELWAARKPVAAVSRGLFWKAVAVFAAAAVIWVLDQNQIVCAPMSPWQGHAVWHALVAVAIGLLYLYCDENLAR